MPVRNLSNILEQFDRWEEALDQEAMTEAAEAGAEIIARAARTLAPVDDRPNAKHRGQLAASIVVERRKSAKLTEGLVLVGPDKRGFYGRFLEQGTKKMKARRWFGPAFELSRDSALDAMATVLRAKLSAVKHTAE